MNLKRIVDYDEISPLVRAYFKVGMVTNIFMKEEDYRQLIAEKALYYYQYEGGLFFFKKRSTDFLCFFQIVNLEMKPDVEEMFKISENLPPVNQMNDKTMGQNGPESMNINHDRVVVLEIVQRPQDHNFGRVKQFFESLGFQVCLGRERLKLDTRFINEEELEVTYEQFSKAKKKSKEIIFPQNVGFATIEDIEGVKDILKENFDKHMGCLPSEKELVNDITNRRILVAFDSSYNSPSKVVGILHFSRKLSGFEIRHLAVSKEYRGQKIASRLVQRYHLEILDLCKESNNKGFTNMNSHLWVAKNNEIAKNFY